MNCEENTIYKGTTPTVRYIFDVVDPANIVVAYLTVEQGRDTIFEKTLGDMIIDEIGDKKCVYWNLSQTDTLKLNVDKKCFITMTYKTADGKRYESLPLIARVARSGKEGEI